MRYPYDRPPWACKACGAGNDPDEDRCARCNADTDGDFLVAVIDCSDDSLTCDRGVCLRAIMGDDEEEYLVLQRDFASGKRAKAFIGGGAAPLLQVVKL